MSKPNYGTHISPRDYRKVGIMCYGEDRKLAANYAIEIAQHHNVDHNKLASVLETLYGACWYEQPYAKLAKVAKAMPQNLVAERYEKKPISGRAMRELKESYTLEDTYSYRKAKRIFGAKNIKACYGDNAPRNAQELSHAILGYRMVQEVEGQWLAKTMKKQLPRLAGIYDTYRNHLGTYNRDYSVAMLPEHIQTTVRDVAKRYAVDNAIRSSFSNPSYRCLISRLLSNISGECSNAIYGRKHGYTNDNSRLSENVANLYELLELEESLATVGLCFNKTDQYFSYEARNWKKTKLEPKFVRIVRNTINMRGYDAGRKREIIIDLFDKLVAERNRKHDRRNWMLPLQIAAQTEGER